MGVLSRYRLWAMVLSERPVLALLCVATRGSSKGRARAPSSVGDREGYGCSQLKKSQYQWGSIEGLLHSRYHMVNT